MTIDIYYRALQQFFPARQQHARLDMEQRQVIRHHRLHCLQTYQADIAVGIDALGKPVNTTASHLVFNHSHSQNFYALAVSETVSNLGIDIEDLARMARFQPLAQHYFHPDELANWYALQCEPQFWLKIWTIKEAIVKAHGMGIRLELNTLNTHAHPDWDFGYVEHPQLGCYAYQCRSLTHSLLTVAYQRTVDSVGHLATLRLRWDWNQNS